MGPLPALFQLAQADCADFFHVPLSVCHLTFLCSGKPRRGLLIYPDANRALVSRTFSFLTSLFVSQLRFLLLQEARVVISARFLRDVDRGRYSGSS